MKTIRDFTTTAALMLVLGIGLASETKTGIDVPTSDTELEILDYMDKGKPIFRQKGDKVFLNMLNLQGEKIEIKVYDSSRRLLFKETITDELTIEKAFNFESAYEDNYTVLVKDSEGTYLERISVK